LILLYLVLFLSPTLAFAQDCGNSSQNCTDIIANHAIDCLNLNQYTVILTIGGPLSASGYSILRPDSSVVLVGAQNGYIDSNVYELSEHPTYSYTITSLADSTCSFQIGPINESCSGPASVTDCVDIEHQISGTVTCMDQQIQNINVNLLSEQSIIASTLVDSCGYFSFCRLYPDIYSVEVIGNENSPFQFSETQEAVIDLNNNVELSFSFESCDSIPLFTPAVSEPNFRVYPNPTNSIIHLSSSDIPFDHYKIYTIHGRTILADKSYLADVSFLDQGLYFVKFYNKSGQELSNTSFIKF